MTPTLCDSIGFSLLMLPLGKDTHSIAPWIWGFRWDILWSDPTDNDTVEGIHENLQRGAAGNICKYAHMFSTREKAVKQHIFSEFWLDHALPNRYGPDRVKSFCADNDLKLIIRAHECVQDGYQYFASCHLITVFSATNYCARYDNDGAFLEISIDGSKATAPASYLGSRFSCCVWFFLLLRKLLWCNAICLYCADMLNVVPKVIKAKRSPASAQGHWRKQQYRPPSPVRGGSK
eukprot:SAG31_NODE_512_length_14721_cov_17.995623_14_plen_234_part_00